MKLRYDPLSPEQLGDPYPMLEQLRRRAPVHHSEGYDLSILTRYDDVVTAGRNTVHFSSRTPTSGRSAPLCPAAAAIATETATVADTLVNADPPEHTLNRKLLNTAFGVRRVAALEPFVQDVTNRLLGAVPGERRFDVVGALAVPLPMTVIGHVLGFEEGAVGTLKRWSDDLALGLSADLNPDEQVRVATSLRKFRAFVVGAVADRRAAPADDFLTELVNARREDGLALTRPQLVSLCEQMLVAGNETTTSLITTTAWLLATDQAAQRAVRADPSLIPAAVEESLRLHAPVQGRYRVTTTDVDVHGCVIPAGSRVQLHFGSANRDPGVYDQPDRFDLRRANPRGHLAFGSGPHFCIGAPLARLEARIAVAGLLRRWPELRLAEGAELRWRRHFHLRGLLALWLEGDRGP